MAGLRAIVFLLAFGWLAVGQAAGPREAGIATAHPAATAAGRAVLERGGNAFDAAVTIAAVLAVVEPYSSGLGGGGFFLLHRASDGHETMLDARERAPLAATRDMYLDVDGRPWPGLSIDGPLAAGIPGLPAALVDLAARYGTRPLAELLAPAIAVARDGFEVDEIYRSLAALRLQALRASKVAARVFLDDNAVPAAGTVIRQAELAETLGRIASEGRAGFYAGVLAQRLVDGVHAAGGVWTLDDLDSYRTVEREPVRFEYRGFRVSSAAPPSSGGVVLAEILNQLAAVDLHALDPAARMHRIVEAMRRAYRDRAEYLGDPDFVTMPLQRLLSTDYARGLAASIDPARATPSDSLAKLAEPAGAGRDTTHFSVLDFDGNRVAATLSINYPFGSGFMPAGTGVLLNDEMDDFAVAAGVPNVYGLIGASANAIAPGKRMLSSMSPSFVDDGHRLAILGTPGGSRIITMVLLAILEFERGVAVDDWVAAPRFHHQYRPDEIQVEPEFAVDFALDTLRERGHQVRVLEERYGNLQAVTWDRGADRTAAASDPRGVGAAAVFSPRKR